MLCLGVLIASARALAAPGDWPEPRQNSHLTAVQPLPGAMTEAPSLLGELDLGRSAPGLTPVRAPEGDGYWGVAIVAGALHCFDQHGLTRWSAHPEGLNFTQLSAVADLDGDGVEELLLQAGRAAEPYGAAVLISLADGAVLWRYDVDPMSYQWYLYLGAYLPNENTRQIIVIMQGYPPDAQNGYIALFAAAPGTRVPEQRWRYDFDQYTCFPSLLRADVDNDRVTELVVETHSRMWILDPATGARESFVQWDVAPANVRSYGLTTFTDLNSDGWTDFLCIADFSQHHEVLLNRAGALEKAWSHGWAESVTTGKVATAWPEPAWADVDGDGQQEVVVSIFNGDNDARWKTRIYDTVSGAIEHTLEDTVAAALHDVDGDGAAEILANRCADPVHQRLEGATVYRCAPDAAPAVLWSDARATALKVTTPQSAAVSRNSGTTLFPVSGERLPLVRTAAGVFELRTEAGAVGMHPFTPPPPPAAPVFANVPAIAGPPAPTLLAADLDSDTINELLTFDGSRMRAWKFADGAFQPAGEWISSVEPALADLNGDGHTEVIAIAVSPVNTPIIEALTPALGQRVLWRQQLGAPDRTGLPQPRTAYLRTGRFTGKATPDVYVFAGTPVVRSLVLDGLSGAVQWEKGQLPETERYWAPTMNDASAADLDGDGAEDLIFTNPDYYCVASGRTGDLLLGPLFPPTIFNQPSQGLYTFPAVLDGAPGTQPMVALAGGHYFQGALSLDGQPHWYSLPPAGQNRCAEEGFVPLANGAWMMGFGRQNGAFACVSMLDGKLRWEVPTGGACSDTIAADVDGDGQLEFVVGTSHGNVLALGDAGGTPRLLWTFQTGAGVNRLIVADLTGDGRSELVCALANGVVQVLGVRPLGVTPPPEP
ncbi:MAG: VCBS repeat-containing protein [Candidatus Hydrogenedentes bacterium]|nr:VCBS repeat-containing protein [Candidatus Hydrogenedentota bacterium]